MLEISHVARKIYNMKKRKVIAKKYMTIKKAIACPQ